RKSPQVHRFATVTIFQKSRARDGYRIQWLQRAAPLHPRLQGLKRAQIRVDAERKRGALHVGRRVCEDSEAGGEALEVVEQKGWTVGRAGGQFGYCADFKIRIGCVDFAECA